MTRPSFALQRAFLVDAIGPAGLTTAAVVGLCVAVLGGQLTAAASVVPAPLQAGQIGLGLLPVALSIGVPIAVLVGIVAAGQAWAEGGDWLSLRSAGLRGSALLPATLALGLTGAGAQGALTHNLAPRGQALARMSFQTGSLTLRAGQPLHLGDLLLVAEEASAGRYRGLALATGDVAVAAREGGFDGAALALEHGSAQSFGERPWRLRFARARVPLPAPDRRVELVERTDADLRALIERMETNGRDAAYEQLILYKRSTLPAAVPLLATLGLPLGLRRVRPAIAAASVGLGWWIATRLCDQAADRLGPELAAAAPLLGLALVTAALWLRWADR